ncbi:hypothetical protein AB1Y20_005897 [Prymnesium parvum]|uniref:Uncharacterized protein n=1 Tax=Prymnesium parvum TaxID=97485 RepID=A0AB34J134_PRYPA
MVAWRGLLAHPHLLTAAPPRMCSSEPPHPRRVPISELRRELHRRGVDTSTLFEREEFMRLLARSAPIAPPPPPEPPLERMHVQEVMEELERRGVEYDVLAPSSQLARLLAAARAAAATAAPRPPAAPRSPPPPTPTPGRARRPPPRAPAPPPSRAAASPSANATALQPAAAVADGFAGLVGAVAETLASTALVVSDLAVGALNSSRQGEWRDAPKEWIAKGPLRRVRPPPKAVLLVFCICALRYGLTRSILIGAAAKLSLDIATEFAHRLQARRRDRQPDSALEA